MRNREAIWPLVTGCTRYSAGCERCYARAGAERCGRSFDVQVNEAELDAPAALRSVSSILVAPNSDLFNEAIPLDFIDAAAERMERSRHTFFVLTKRVARALEWARRRGGIPPNVWLGATVENRAALGRLDLLRQAPAANRFVAFEPLLEDLGQLDLSQLDWVVVGGEHGPASRPCEIAWIGSVISQAAMAGVPAYVTQLGGSCGLRLRDSQGRDAREWPLEFRVRQYPEALR